METKFGTTTLSHGYHVISSTKEGNHHKALHRLIFEDFYQIQLPENIVIHHNDGDKTNNEIWNLIPMTRAEHSYLHGSGENNPFYGKHHSEEAKEKLREKNSGENHVFFGKTFKDSHKRKISASRNTTGYRNVCIQPCPSCKKNFRYRYGYFEDGKQKAIQSVSLEKLQEKVLNKGLPWEKLEDVV